MSDAQRLVRGLQERTARALPAEHSTDVDGWWLRYSPHCSWWVGTVLPHADVEPALLVPRIVAVEEFYAGHDAIARFQISPGVGPAELDAVLAQRGYRRDSVVSLRIASTVQVLAREPTGPLRVRCDDRPTRAWFDVWDAVHGDGGHSGSEWDLLGRIQRPCGYVRVTAGDDVLAVGRAVADTGWAGIFGMATRPEARGQGAARHVLAGLARWADAQAADRMYLQVERDNVAALRLYERMGFTELCAYHYRIAGEG